MKRALIAQCLHLNSSVLLCCTTHLHTTSPSICSLVTAVFRCCTSCGYFEPYVRYWCPVWSRQSSDPVRPLLFLSSQWKSECCHSALKLLLAVSEALLLAPGVGFWLQARGPCQRARNDVAHNLQMLACIRAWQLVMSPPTLPHSSITSHLLPDTSWGRRWGIDAGSLGLHHPSARRTRSVTTATFVCGGGTILPVTSP